MGSISEKTFVDFFLEYEEPPSSDMLVSEIMDEKFPSIPEDASSTRIFELLQSNHGLLVTKNGKIAGIITKADLLKFYAR